MDNSQKDRANAQFNKLQRAEEGKRNTSEYESNAAAVRKNTERLKTLRLARDAAEQATAPAAAPPAKKKSAKTGKKTAKDAGQSLSGWLKAREGSGRNN